MAMMARTLGGAAKLFLGASGSILKGPTKILGKEAVEKLGRGVGKAQGWVDNVVESAVKKDELYKAAKQQGRGLKEAVQNESSDVVSNAIKYETAAKQKHGFTLGDNQYARTGAGTEEDPYQYYSRANKKGADWQQMDQDSYMKSRNEYIKGQREAGHQADIDAAYKADNVAEDISRTGVGDGSGFDIQQAISDHPYRAMAIAGGTALVAANLFDDDY